jgi:hypothetical protein
VGRGKPRRPRRWLLLVIVRDCHSCFSLRIARPGNLYLGSWFGSLGYSAVFWYIFKLKLVLFLIFFALTVRDTSSRVLVGRARVSPRSLLDSELSS